MTLFRHVVALLLLVTCYSSLCRGDFGNRNVLYHGHTVWTAALSPNGAILASSDKLGMVRLWETATGKPWGALTGHRDAVYALAFSRDGQLLATGGVDNSIRVWSVYTGRQIARFDPNSWSVLSLCFDQGARLLSCHANGSVIIWNVAERREERRLTGHDGMVYCGVFSPDAGKVFTAGEDGKLVRHAGDSGEVLQETRLSGALRSIAISTTGDEVAVASADRFVARRRSDDLAEIETIRTRAPVYTVAYSDDGQRLSYGEYSDSESNVVLRDLRRQRDTGICTESYLKAKVSGLVFGKQGRFLAAACHNGMVRLLAISPQGELGPIPTSQARRHSREGLVVAERPNGGWVTGSKENIIRQYSEKDGVRTANFGEECYSVAVLPEGMIAVGGKDNKVRIYNSDLSRVVTTLPSTNAVTNLAVSSTQPLLAWGTTDGVVEVWRLSKRPQRLKQVRTRAKEIACVVFSDHGKWLAYTTDYGSAHVLDVIQDYKEIAKADTDSSSFMWGLCFCGPIDRFVLGSANGWLYVLDVAKNRVEKLPPTYGGGIDRVVSIPGTRLVVLSRLVSREASRLEIWNMEIQQPVAEAYMRDTRFRSFIVTRDARKLLAASMDGKMAVWDLGALFLSRPGARLPEFLGLPPAAIDVSDHFISQLPARLRRLTPVEKIDALVGQIERVTAEREKGNRELSFTLATQAVALAKAKEDDGRLVLGMQIQALADEYTDQGRYRDALATLTWANHLIRFDDKPDTALADNHQGFACLWQVLGKHGHAKRHWETAISIRSQLLKQLERLDPANVRWAINAAEKADDIPTLWKQVSHVGLPSTRCMTLSSLLAHTVALAEAEYALGQDVTGTLQEFDRILEQLREMVRTNRSLLKFAMYEFDEAKKLALTAAVSYRRGDAREAARAMEQAISMLRDEPAGENLIAGWLQDLGVALLATGEFDRAEKNLIESIAMHRRIFGNDHIRIWRARAQLASLKLAQQEFEGAYELANSCVVGLAEAQVPSSLYSLQPSLIKGRALVQLRETEKAIPVIRTVMEQATELLRRGASSLPERQMVEYVRQFQRFFFNRSLITLWPLRDDPVAAELIAEIMMNCRGLTVQLLAEKARASRELDVFEMGDTRNKLLRTRELLSEVYTDRQTAGADSLLRRERELSAELGRLSTLSAKQHRWIPLQELRASLPKRSVHVAFLEATFGKAGTAETVFDTCIAVIIPAADEEGLLPPVEVLDLGKTEPIIKVVRQYREAVADKQRTILDLGEAMAALATQRIGRELSRLILDPLMPYCTDKSIVTLSPDRALWFVPWCALPLEDGSLAVEKMAIELVSSIQPSDGRNFPTSGAFVLADADFNADTETNKQPEEPPTLGSGVLQRSVLPFQYAPRLPGTRAEAKAVQSPLRDITGGPPHVVMGSTATETAVKSLVSPQIAVFATHGFFTTGGENAPFNPLLRCGLYLAGSNQRSSGMGEDGILTGLEVAGLRLDGTELVVLSACETGLGDARSGDGVDGLKQAFQTAGAKSVVASLWSVPDQNTARLMEQFFQHLASGVSNAESLRRSQIIRIEAHRKSEQASHPYFWAAFNITRVMEVPMTTEASRDNVADRVEAKDHVMVIADQALIQSGKQVLLSPKKGTRLRVDGQKEFNGILWLKVRLPGTSTEGWIQQRFVSRRDS